MPQPTPLANALAQYAPPKQTPSTPLANALMEYAARVKGDFQHGLDESAQGFGEMMNGQFATGVPRTFLGGLGWMGSPVSGAVSPLLNPVLQPVAQGVHDYVGQPIENATGYPADLTTELALALALPKALHGAGKAVNSAVPYLASLGDAVGLKPTPANQYNMFIGGRAKNFPHDMVPRAEKLEAEGISASDIHDMTGLHRGADGKWRAEIDDSNSAISSLLPNALGSGNEVAAGSYFMHPKLYEAYPQLADVKLTNQVPDGARGAAYGGRIGLAKDIGTGGDARGTLLHEFQHEIQNIEGFAKGGNINEFAFISRQQAEDALWLKNYIEMEGGTQAGIERFTKTIGRAPTEKTVNAALLPNDMLIGASAPEYAYKRLAGETEARNTQYRRGMTADERAASYPLSTQDVPTDRQTVRGVSGVQASSDPKSPISSPVGGDEGIIAYHGSPHKFDQFSLDYKGIGHGKQQEGDGLFFTSDENLAENYRANHEAKSPEKIAEKFLTNWGSEAPNKLKAYVNKLSGERNSKFVEPYRKASELVDSGNIGRPGAVYQVKLNVSPSEVYDTTIPNGGRGGQPANFNPMSLTPETAKAHGIKAVAYKSGIESGKKGAKNYVVFDDSIISILKRYGIPMTAGAGGAMMVAGQNMPPEVANQLGPQS